MGGDHLFKGGVQFGRLSYESDYDVQNNIYLLYTNGVPTSVREWNTPTISKNVDKMLGLFVQDAWTVGRKLTLNLGLRFDHNAGILPEQSNPQRAFVGPQSHARDRRRSTRTCSSGAPACPTIRSATARPRSRRATAATGCRSASIA